MAGILAGGKVSLITEKQFEHTYKEGNDGKESALESSW